MAKKTSKGGEVTSVEVGPTWVYVTLRFPTKALVPGASPSKPKAGAKKTKGAAMPAAFRGIDL